jgi:membrane protease YdiL (CAAX protease family)
MNIYKLIAALILALILMAVFFIGAVVSRMLNLLPPPWDVISNGALALTGLTVIIYIWIGKLEKRKEGSDGN